jgi:elongation factor Ts
MDVEKIKKLRSKTGISLMECKKALEEAGGSLEKAQEFLKKRSLEIVVKKKQREAGVGIVESYVHPDKKTGVLLDIRCETDFVAKNKEFQDLAHEICLHIAAMDPEKKNALLKQAWIRDQEKTIRELINEYIAKLGENIVIERFMRYEI